MNKEEFLEFIKGVPDVTLTSCAAAIDLERQRRKILGSNPIEVCDSSAQSETRYFKPKAIGYPGMDGLMLVKQMQSRIDELEYGIEWLFQLSRGCVNSISIPKDTKLYFIARTLYDMHNKDKERENVRIICKLRSTGLIVEIAPSKDKPFCFVDVDRGVEYGFHELCLATTGECADFVRQFRIENLKEESNE